MSDLPPIRLDARAPTVEGASAELLRELLEIWKAELQKRQFPFNECVQPGLDAPAIARRLSADTLPASPEVTTWFGWFDGQSSGTPTLVPGLRFVSLDSAIADRSIGIEIGTRPGMWNPEWIRLCDNTVSLAVNAAEVESPRVRIVDNGGLSTWEAEQHTETHSLCTAVVWFVEALRNGTHSWNPKDRQWQEDRSVADPIAAVMAYI